VRIQTRFGAVLMTHVTDENDILNPERQPPIATIAEDVTWHDGSQIQCSEYKRVVLLCLDLVADLIYHVGTNAVDKVKQIFLFDTTAVQRCADASADLKEELIQKLIKISSRGIHPD